MEYIFGFIIFSLIVFLAAVKIFPHQVTIQEVLIGTAIQAAIVSVIFFGAFYGTGHDTQILNGVVVSKEKDKVSCEHSYSCNCYNSCSGTGSNRSCTRVCQTCYEHSHDFDWLVHSTVGTASISRVDRQGVDTPPRWSLAVIGEFFAREDSYFNYIKASPLTLFDSKTLDSTIEVPPYIEVYDYYRLNRVVNYGSRFLPQTTELNDMLNEQFKTLGTKKKVNLLVIFHSQGSDFVEATKAKLYGGKINDVTVMINANEDGTVNAVDVFSWSKQDIVNVAIRDALLDVGVTDNRAITAAITSNIDKHFDGKSIEEFEYLSNNVELPTWALVMIYLFGLAFPFGWSYYAHQADIGPRNFKRRY